jgi:hypothetical protein
MAMELILSNAWLWRRGGGGEKRLRLFIETAYNPRLMLSVSPSPTPPTATRLRLPKHKETGTSSTKQRENTTATRHKQPRRRTSPRPLRRHPPHSTQTTRTSTRHHSLPPPPLHLPHQSILHRSLHPPRPSHHSLLASSPLLSPLHRLHTACSCNRAS